MRDGHSLIIPPQKGADVSTTLLLFGPLRLHTLGRPVVPELKHKNASVRAASPAERRLSSNAGALVNPI